MRLIDVDVLIKQFCMNCLELDGDEHCDFRETCADIEILRDSKTIDPVKHGKWIEHRGYYKCSECGCWVVYETNYCPECGAKNENEV